jgi:hypothetical protein
MAKVQKTPKKNRFLLVFFSQHKKKSAKNFVDVIFFVPLHRRLIPSGRFRRDFWVN